MIEESGRNSVRKKQDTCINCFGAYITRRESDRAGTTCSFVYVINESESDRWTPTRGLSQSWESKVAKTAMYSSPPSIMRHGSLATVTLLALRFIGVFAQDVRFLPEATWQQADFLNRQTKKSKTLPPSLT